MEPSKTSGKQANPKISSSTKMGNSAVSLSEHLLRQIGAIRMSQSWRGSVTIWQAVNVVYTALLHLHSKDFRRILASLYEGLSIRPSIRLYVRRSVRNV